MKKFAKTKIVATIGPASWDDNILKQMIDEGMDIARINTSFADFDELDRVSKKIRNISPKVTIMLDLEGHKIRTRGIEGEYDLKVNQLLPISGDPTSTNCIHINYPTLHDDVTRGTRILIDDGRIITRVKEIKGDIVITEIEQGGILRKNKTVNVPDVHLNFPIISPKDRDNVLFAVEHNFDYISASFVRSKEDILEIRKLTNDSKIGIIAKIENEEGVRNIEEIIDVSDGIMVARGDLGVEMRYEEIPIIQKSLIYKCRLKGKPVIVATQMLESMKESLSPSRSDVSDIANAVMDGTDAVMLSAETSVGNNPVECITVMNTIVSRAEDILKPQEVYGSTDATEETDEICRNLLGISKKLNLNGVVVLCNTGKTVASLSRHRLNIPIWAISFDPTTIRQLNLFRGVKSFYNREFSKDRDESTQRAVESVYAYGELEMDDKIAIISGSSIRYSLPNTTLEIATVKDILGR